MNHVRRCLKGRPVFRPGLLKSNTQQLMTQAVLINYNYILLQNLVMSLKEKVCLEPLPPEHERVPKLVVRPHLGKGHLVLIKPLRRHLLGLNLHCTVGSAHCSTRKILIRCNCFNRCISRKKSKELATLITVLCRDNYVSHQKPKSTIGKNPKSPKVRLAIIHRSHKSPKNP